MVLDEIDTCITALDKTIYLEKCFHLNVLLFLLIDNRRIWLHFVGVAFLAIW